MKYVKWTITILLIALAFAWTIKLHRYFYEHTPADVVTLMAMLMVGFIMGHKLAARLQTFKWILAVGLVAGVFGMYPLIVASVSQSDWSWLILYTFLLLSGAGAMILQEKRQLALVTLAYLTVFFIPFGFEASQLQFYDKLQSAIETRHSHAQIVNWKKDHWLYYDKQLQYATIDKHLYQEAYVQPIMQWQSETSRMLVIGGDNGLVEDELSKFEWNIPVTIISLDEEFRKFVRSNEFIATDTLAQKNLSQEDPFHFLAEQREAFDFILIDVPDPVNVHHAQYYSIEFYQLCQQALTKNGLMVTQAGDAYKAGEWVEQIEGGIQASGLQTLRYQAQVPTIGQWTWVLAANGIEANQMEARLRNVVPKTSTIWWNQEAMDLMLSSGNKYFFKASTQTAYSLTTVSNDSL